MFHFIKANAHAFVIVLTKIINIIDIPVMLITSLLFSLATVFEEHAFTIILTCGGVFLSALSWFIIRVVAQWDKLQSQSIKSEQLLTGLAEQLKHDREICELKHKMMTKEVATWFSKFMNVEDMFRELQVESERLEQDRKDNAKD